jgi:hypothetical protein
MVEIAIEINELRDAEEAARIEDEIYEAAATAAPAVEDGPVGFSVLDEGRSVDIQVVVPGWVGHRTLQPRPLPGEARRAAQELLELVALR